MVGDSDSDSDSDYVLTTESSNFLMMTHCCMPQSDEDEFSMML
jgi:hypothetical protein